MTKYFKVEVDPKVLQVAEWASFIPPADTKYPRVYLVADGSAKVYFGLSFYSWLAAPQVPVIVEDVPAEILPAPNVGFSEGFILRALAIAQDPKLAKELV